MPPRIHTMHITLIQPCVGRKPDGTPYPASWRMEPLGIARLASLTPPEIRRAFFDDRLAPFRPVPCLTLARAAPGQAAWWLSACRIEVAQEVVA